MAAKYWTIDQLKSQLSKRKDVKAWIISQENVHRRERYFLNDSGKLAIDQDREVNSQNINLRLFVPLAAPGRQGEITKKLFTARPLDEQLDSAIAAAEQTDHQSWDLPTEVPKNVPQYAACDPQMEEDLNGSMDKATIQISEAVSQKRATDFNSAELFLSVHNRTLHLSNGLTHRTAQSRAYVEAAYSMTQGTASDEYLHTSWSVHLGDLPIGKLFDEASERAENSLDVRKPMSGSYAVIIDSEVLATLFHGYFSQLSAANAYHKLPFIKPGNELIAQAQGELLTIAIDPSLEYGAGTAALSDQGIVQKRLVLVDRNRVLATATDKQYADYLGTEVTTTRGNLVIETGKHSHEELTQASPQVLEILQFSGLFMNGNTGTFGSEIRLAKLYDQKSGSVRYIKGGSLSGSIQENFKDLKLSNKQIKRAHFSSDKPTGDGYVGPEYALLSNVSVVG